MLNIIKIHIASIICDEFAESLGAELQILS